MKQIAGWIHQVLSNADDEQTLLKVRDQVKKLCQEFPLYQDLMED
jgi:glycine hydroxymethyltransferase